MATTKVYEENHFYIADNVTGTGGTVTVEQDAFIFGTGDNGLEFDPGVWKIKVDGYIESNLNGIALYDGNTLVPNSSLTIGTEGRVIGTGTGDTAANKYSAISSALAMDVTNSGLIQGDEVGLYFHDMFHSASKTITVVNNASGQILGSDFGIFLDSSKHDLILKNAGVIDEVWWGRGSNIINSGTIEELYEYSSVEAYNNTITNSGTIKQGIGGGHGDDKVTNSGTIGTGLSLIDGNNTIINKGSIGHSGPDGSVYAGDGNDTLTNTGDIDSFIMLDDGINKVTNSGTIGGLITLGTGNDTVINSGSIGGGISLGAGDNRVTNSGHITGDLYTAKDSGLNTISNTKLIDGGITVIYGDLTLTNGGTIGGSIETGAGTHKITNTGTIVGNVQLARDVNVVVNSGEIGGDVIVQYGNVTVTNKGHIAGMVDGSSTDILKLTNNGIIDDHVTGATGNDVLINTKLIASYVDLGAGDNKITNSGTILASLDTGGGNDVINSTGHVGGEIRGGGGDDKITCGGDDDFIRDGAGNDVYSLGAGDDTVWGAAGNDIIDGGAGFDYFNGRPYGSGLSINLDSKAVIVTGHNLAASSLVMGGTVVTLKGFEEVHGSDFGDVLAGTAGHDRIMGNSGSDTIYGGGGGDDLYGGTSDSDIFVYLNVKDSGNTTATRDVIHDFDGAGVTGGDVIDLSGIDANSTKAGNDTFTIIGGDKEFSHAAGELRWIHLLDTTIIQGDVNGDGKADFAIEVVGLQNFSTNGDDFNP